jgi:molybdopterin converting factor subunit 1
MKIQVKLFAAARELAGHSELELNVGDAASVADIRRAVEHTHPELHTILPHALWAVDAEYANDDTPVNETSEIAIIPPVSGG